MGTQANQYDVFLSYHWRDHDAVERIAESLATRGLRVFFDRWYLTPGVPWPQNLEQILGRCHAVAVCVGPEGMGPWQLREQFLALDRQSREEAFPVIPVLLPGADPPLGFLKLNTWVVLRAGADHALAIETIARAIRGLPPGPDLVAKVLAGICPYRGLQVFREEDAPFFFGRETFAARLAEEVERKSFIAVVGASGSGKSSVVRAGLVPRLRAGADGHVWDVLTLTPGSRPLQALAAAIIPLLTPDLGEVDRLAELGKLAHHFASNIISLPDVLLRCLEKQRGTDRLLLIIDQWEELYSLCKDDTARTCFIGEMLAASAHTPVKVVLTLRGDFYGRALSHRALVDRLQDTVVNLGPMTREELRRTLEKPAAQVQLEFEPGLVDRILDDVGEQPGNLPLLEFVLATLWEKRRGCTLHFEAYEGMKGIKGAIANRADQLFQTELTEDQRQAARRVLMHLVRPGEGTPDTRKRALLPTADDPALAVVRKLADARLLVTGRDETQLDAQTVEIAHEALIQNWGLLQQWVNEDREFLRTRERIEAAAALWEQEGRLDDRLLAAGRPLAEAEDLLAKRRPDLNPVLIRFVEASVAAEQRRRDAARAAQLRRLKRTRLAAVASLLIAFVMAGVGMYANNRRMAADQATGLAREHRDEAVAAQAAAEREREKALSRGLAVQASALVERGQGDEAMLKAAALAVESWRRMPNADAYAAATKLLQWFPVRRIEADPGASPESAEFAFSPDGRYLVIRSGPTIRLVETASCKELGRIEAGETASLMLSRFSADSRLFLIYGRDTRLISTESAREVFSAGAGKFTSHNTLYQRGGSSAFATLSPDGRWLALTAEDNGTRTDTITVIDTHSGKEACRIEHPMNRPQGGVLGVFFSPNGELLGIKDRFSFHLFEIPGGRERTRITVSDAVDAEFVGDGRCLVIDEITPGDDSRTLHLFDPGTGGELSTIPLGKTGRVEFSGDGRLMLTRDENDKTIRLLEVPTGTERLRWKERVDRSSLDKSGQWLLLVNKSGLICLIDAASGQETSRAEPNCEIGGVEFRAESDSLLTSCKGGEFIVFKASTGKETTRFRVDGRHMFFSPDGRFIVTQAEDNKALRLHDTSTGQEFGRIATGGPIRITYPSLSVSGTSTFSNDGRYLAIPSPRGSIQLVDLSRAHNPFRLEAARDGPIALSNDRRLLAFADPDHAVRVVDLATGQDIGSIRQDQPAYPVNISADGQFLMTQQKSILRLHEVKSGREVARLLRDSSNSSNRISPDGNHLVIEDHVKDSLRLVASSSLKEIMRYPSSQLCCQPVFSPDGRLFAIANRFEHIVQLFDTESGEERMRIAPDVDFRTPLGPCCPEFSPDGQSLAVDVLGTVRLLDVSTGTWLKHRWSSQHGSTSESSFSPDGRTLAIVKGLNIQLFDVATERELVRVSSRSWGSHGSTEPLYEFRFAFNTDSRLFAVGTAAGDPVRLFETATGTELTRMDLGWGFAGVLFSPDGRSLAAASNNGSVRLLDVDSRRLPGTSQHAKAVTHLEFSPDSRFLVTSGKDGAALMTETPTGREIARFEHGEPITEAHFSPDGQSLLTVGGEKVKIWPGDPEWPFQQLCARAGRNLTSEEWRTFIGESEPWRPTCPNWHQVAVSEPTRQ